ncbi:hypothetical protein Pcar_3469 [Syntrophotalea carbinolica DSM 2380]|uniref:Uncharacterized protein n=1 Tax=Syntrophotalea carbinolica (strain DSM 2380 / NBRC 103641 / GraBd1) TaxID=338963 RepID=J9U430_SYNC1|nr:hypothetical protein Pcar_3469 [Syntrophotalea carbinolica DSM 2380]
MGYRLTGFADLGQPRIFLAIHIDIKPIGGTEKHTAKFMVNGVFKIYLRTLVNVMATFLLIGLSHNHPLFEMRGVPSLYGHLLKSDPLWF